MPGEYASRFFRISGNWHVLLPFIFWMMKREEVNGINKHGKDILNGQLTYSILISLLVLMQTAFIIATMFFPGN
jgi:uncharacterized Tic20 family protein